MTHAVRSSMQVDLAEQPARRSEMLLQSPDFSDLPQLHVNGEVNLRPLCFSHLFQEQLLCLPCAACTC